MPRTIKIAGGLLLLSIATLFIRKPALFLFVKINDLFLALSLIFLLIAVTKKEVSLQLEKKVFMALLFWLSSVLIGTLLSFILFGHPPISAIIQGYARFLACTLIFTEIIIISKYDNYFPKKALLSFLFSLLVIVLAYIPSFKIYFMDSVHSKFRFSGLSDNSNFYAYFELIPTMILFFFLLKSNKKILLRILGFFIFCASIGTIIWSGSRSGIIGLSVSFILMLFFLLRSSGIKKTAIALLLIIIAFPIGYFMLPSKASNDIENRVAIVTSPVTAENDNTVKKTEIVATAGQDRVDIWKSAIVFVEKNPLGYGLGYDKIINIQGDGAGSHLTVHNIELQALLSGGILLFACLNIALFYLFRKPISSAYFFLNFNEVHILLAILAGMFVSGLFIDSLDFRWIWVCAGLILAYHQQFSSTAPTKEVASS